MKELEDLNETEKAVLFACCDANNFSLKSRVPIEAIAKRVQISGKFFKKVIRLLLSNGFIREHPSGRKTTYELTRKGWKAGYKLK
ncbi:MAG: hypothetical protein ACFE75_02510 [Candidatus Hodarchaeota archaeon]